MEKEWIVKSLTMWGVFMTVLTGSLPAINALLPVFHQGWSLEPNLINSLNTGVVALITALGSVVGVVLIIVDRIRASYAPPKKLTLLKPKA